MRNRRTGLSSRTDGITPNAIVLESDTIVMLLTDVAFSIGLAKSVVNSGKSQNKASHVRGE